MRRLKLPLLRRFRDDTEGVVTVEFVIIFPVFIALLLIAVELGFITMRYALLERGLDMTVREIRLGTGADWQHDEIKDKICDNALSVAHCKESLRLEMRQKSIRNYTSLSDTVDCTDRAEETNPVAFQTGGENDLMVLRACYKYRPLFPAALLGSKLTKDASGDASIVAMTAFVQEPK
ncbi:pilus assembly protein [Roseovarius sp. A21]|uniref:Pilus assembly protein n=1 Tax=Roseovarius bejariae TaxID=2576383 RepID=A0A844CWK5_9RHOB|nr:TadE family protein [Roseovarius bejariae]MRU16469.1 pilus assembly protein [Roseovarius bejariae]